MINNYVQKELSKNKLHRYKKLIYKKYRHEYKEFIIEGIKLIEEAQKKKNILKCIITSNRNFISNCSDVYYCSYDDICKLSTTKSPQEYIGICNFLNFNSNEISDFILILDNINDPGNLGTLIRTGYSFGVKDIVVSGVDIYNPKVLRSTQGSIFWVNIINVNNIEEIILNLKFNHYKIIGSLLNKSYDYNKVKINDKKLALVLGNESNGISKNIVSLLDYKVYIPIKFESLNVAIAGAILLSKYLK